MAWFQEWSHNCINWGLSHIGNETRIRSKSNWNTTFGPPREDFASDEVSSFLLSPAQLGIITGFVVAYFLNYKLKSLLKSDSDLSKQLQWITQVVSNQWKYLVKVLLAFSTFVTCLPLILMFVAVFYVYRKLAVVCIKQSEGEKFAGMLEGHDAVWAVEHPNWLSVINILATLEGDQNSVDILLAIRKRIASKLLNERHSFPKMFYRRVSKFGYTYWKKEVTEQLSVETHIRYVNIPCKNPGQLTEEDVKVWIGKCYNAKLPHNHEATWEILVSRRTMVTYGEKKSVYPVLFRVHHSLGDGVALLRFVLETIADKKQNIVDLWHQCTPTRVKKLMTITEEATSSDDPPQADDSQKKALPKFKVVINFNGILEKFIKLLHFIGLLIAAPLSLSEQAIFLKRDDNPVHNSTNQELSGDKFVEWFWEPDENLFQKIKTVKNLIPGSRFSDVFLTALSSSFYELFKTKAHLVPEQMTIVIPLRMEPTSSQLRLQNRFSVGLQKLPIVNPIKDFASLEVSVTSTKRWTDDLRSKPDYLINYWILCHASLLLPKQVLGPMVYSKHSSMVMSNLPGPEKLVQIQGFSIKNLSFWLPNRGTTGLGVTLLTYDNKLQFGIGGDKSVLAEEADAKFIVKHTVQEIEKMYQIVV